MLNFNLIKKLWINYFYNNNKINNDEEYDIEKGIDGYVILINNY